MLGEVLGSYRLQALIGKGGMGDVYVGEHNLIGRTAAIKVLKASLSSKQRVVERFFNEARTVSAINHPGIVEIYDFGYHNDGSAYLVMEYLEGESLADRIRALGTLNERETIRIARQICSALGAAHAGGIVHRDLKPANIHIVADPEMPYGERIKILDFGLAKLVDAPTKTNPGAVLGTPAYMSPEQCRGAGQVDARADLYSVGCIMFHMLCGRPPFVNKGAVAMMAAQIQEAPPTVRQLRPELRPEMEAVIAKLLDKLPEGRYPDAAALVVALSEARRALRGATRSMDGVEESVAGIAVPDAGDSSAAPSLEQSGSYAPAPATPSSRSYAPAAPATPGSGSYPPAASSESYPPAPSSGSNPSFEQSQPSYPRVSADYSRPTWERDLEPRRDPVSPALIIGAIVLVGALIAIVIAFL